MVGATTFADDAAGLLRSTATMLESGDHMTLYVLVALLCLWMLYDMRESIARMLQRIARLWARLRRRNAEQELPDAGLLPDMERQMDRIYRQHVRKPRKRGD